MHSAFVFIGPGSITEQPRDGRLHFSSGIRIRAASLLHNPASKLVLAHRQVLRNIVENLRAIMRCASSPTTCRVCCLNRVTNILAIALAHLSNHLPLGIIDIPAVATIRPCLLAADKHLWRDRKSTRLNSSHANISYAVFCLKKKKKKKSWKHMT